MSELSDDELEGLRLALAEADSASERAGNDVGEWAAIAGTRGAAAKLLLAHVQALEDRADSEWFDAKERD